MNILSNKMDIKIFKDKSKRLDKKIVTNDNLVDLELNNKHIIKIGNYTVFNIDDYNYLLDGEYFYISDSDKDLFYKNYKIKYITYL